MTNVSKTFINKLEQLRSDLIVKYNSEIMRIYREYREKWVENLGMPKPKLYPTDKLLPDNETNAEGCKI